MVSERLDRIITIQQRVESRDDFGGVVEQWVDLDIVWARFERQSGQEPYRREANRQQAIRRGVLRIRYRDDVTEISRIVYQDHAWDILGIDEVGYRRYMDLSVQTEVGGERFLPRHYTILAGISDDNTPEAAELTIAHSGGRITLEMFTDKHVLIGRAASEPALTTVVFDDDVTRANQIAGFTQFATLVAVDGVDYNVWVSNQLLTFDEEKTLEVA